MTDNNIKTLDFSSEWKVPVKATFRCWPSFKSPLVYLSLAHNSIFPAFILSPEGIRIRVLFWTFKSYQQIHTLGAVRNIAGWNLQFLLKGSLLAYSVYLEEDIARKVVIILKQNSVGIDSSANVLLENGSITIQ